MACRLFTLLDTLLAGYLVCGPQAGDACGRDRKVLAIAGELQNKQSLAIIQNALLKIIY